jgi:hypothetical protein
MRRIVFTEGLRALAVGLFVASKLRGRRNVELRNVSSERSICLMNGSGMALQQGNGYQTQTTAQRTSAVNVGTLERLSSATVGALFLLNESSAVPWAEQH